jgi:CHAT domain-containing protein/Tfp pilus assembly protein PilF
MGAGAAPPGGSGARAAPEAAVRVDEPSAFSQGLLDSLASLLKEGRYAAAESIGIAALAEAEASGEPESRAMAKSIESVVTALWRGGKAAEPRTRGLAERNVELKKRVFGPEDDEVAAALTDLANVHQAAGDFTRSRRLFEEALAVRENALGPDHVKVTYTLVNLGAILYMTGDLAGARLLFERAAKIQEAGLGPESPNFAGTLCNLANLYADLGRFADAKANYVRGIGILEKAYGPDHPRFAGMLENLASLYHELGDYGEARAIDRRTASILEKTLGPDHPETARSLERLATDDLAVGDYAAARPRFERALAIKEKALGPDHRDVSETLGHLAILFREVGDYSAARPLAERSLSIRERALGADNVDVARGLDDLASILVAVGDIPGARALTERALAVLERVTGAETYEVGREVNNLGDLSRKAGDADAARAHFERALAIWEKALGPDHPLVAVALDNLADVRRDAGDFSEARLLYERAIAIRERTFGTESPLVARTLGDLAILLARSGDARGARDAAVRAEALGREHLRLTVRTLPERQALRFASVRASGLDVLLTLSAASAGAADVASAAGDAETAALAWDAEVRSRALVLNAIASRHRALSEQSESGAAPLAETYFAAQQRRANLLVRRPGDEDPDRLRAILDDARREEEAAERALLDVSAAFRAQVASDGAGLSDVVSSLPDGSALLAYVRFEDPTRGAVPVPCYLAFVLGARGAAPIAVALGPAAPIDSLVSRWREQAGREPDVLDPSRSEVRCREAGTALRARIWDPISPHISGTGRVFIVPDAALYLVNFSALPVDEAEFLVERGPLIHLLSAERDLLLAREPTPQGTGLLAMGDPDYDAAVAIGAEGSLNWGVAASALAGVTVFRGEVPHCRGFWTARWPRLPGTGREIRDATHLWKKHLGEVLTMTRQRASEAAFKEHAPGHRVIHVASHGFFLGAECAGAGGRRGIGGFVAEERAPSVEPTPESAENPLLLSGLVLAGANRRGALGTVVDGEDGIVTAEEVAALDLRGVEWAVLSACATGVAEVRTGEGVFGLRRAFQVAGARTVITSFWSVGDVSTRDWMKALYEARLSRGLGTAEAVREASLAMLAQARRSGSSHPFTWASFVATGDWR